MLPRSAVRGYEITLVLDESATAVCSPAVRDYEISVELNCYCGPQSHSQWISNSQSVELNRYVLSVLYTVFLFAFRGCFKNEEYIKLTVASVLNFASRTVHMTVDSTLWARVRTAGAGCNKEYYSGRVLWSLASNSNLKQKHAKKFKVQVRKY